MKENRLYYAKYYEMHMLIQIRSMLQNLITNSTDKVSMFFKTGTGQYAEGDTFIGVTVPNLRKLAKQFPNLADEHIRSLLISKINEERLLALIILVQQYNKASEPKKKMLYQFYMEHLSYVNNWNLVDAAAHLILGTYIYDKDRTILLKLAQSEVLWERRIAIVSTWYFIRNNDLEWTYTISQKLLSDREDLIHKAVGWMLREAGKKNINRLLLFLEQHATTMPRTMLRYAIEKLSPEQKAYYLKKKRTIIND